MNLDSSIGRIRLNQQIWIQRSLWFQRARVDSGVNPASKSANPDSLITNPDSGWAWILNPDSPIGLGPFNPEPGFAISQLNRPPRGLQNGVEIAAPKGIQLNRESSIQPRPESEWK